MGSLKYVHGDIFTTTDPIIAHGCNTKGGFGSGMAGAIAKLHPEVREQYRYKFKTVGWKLGQVQFVAVSDSLTIANMATQDDYGYDGKLYLSYDALRECFETLLEYAEKEGLPVSIPNIGCGLAGGDWNVVEQIIVDLLKRFSVSVTVYQQ